MNYDAILGTSFQSQDLDETTIREYLHAFLTRLLTEEEGFSGKRPFGNSGWKYDLYNGLDAAGVLKDAVRDDPDEDGHLLEFDQEDADALILELVDHVFGIEVTDV